MKKIFFAINTLSRAGAEIALLELLKRLKGLNFEIYLYVMMQQGELIDQIPSYVKILNSKFSSNSVFSDNGKKTMIKTVARSFFKNDNLLGKLRRTKKIYRAMKRKGKIQMDKLLWRTIAEGADRFDMEFDLAVAWLEGGSSYYIADYVKARRKAAIIHIDYLSSGYTHEMDLNCFDKFDKIFCVSDETRKHFISFYPESENKTDVVHNMINSKEIINDAKTGNGFEDNFDGLRLLTVGRLTHQKAYDIAVETMELLKDRGLNVRWYVIGEGPERKSLEKKILELGLKENFILKGAVDNPYPYFMQCDIYVHATRFEGKSIAVQEAQILGKPIIATNCRGNREQIENGTDGILCELHPFSIAESINKLIKDEGLRKSLGQKAAEKNHEHTDDMQKILTLLN